MAHSGIFQQRVELSAPALAPEPKCFQYDIHPELVAVAEAIRKRLFGVVDSDGRVVELVRFDALVERRSREPVVVGRWIIEARFSSTPLKCHIDAAWHLGGKLVKREGGDHAEDALRDAGCDCDEVGISQRFERGEPKESSTEHLNDAGVAHRVEHFAIHPQTQSIGHA
jgi:hypothetical protein